MKYWLDYLPTAESQIVDGVDSMECTAHATLDAVSILLWARFGIRVEFDEALLSRLAGTGKKGNDPLKVARVVKSVGLDRLKIDYRGSLSQYVFDFNVIRADEVLKWLEVSPVGVALHAWVESEKGIYIDVGAEVNHWTLIVGEDEKYFYVWDSLEPYLKKIDRGRCKFWYALTYSVRLKRSDWLHDILMGIWQSFHEKKK